MKKIILLAVIAALGSLAANAVPVTSWTGFYLSGTLNVQDGDRFRSVSFGDKDLLTLIGGQYNITIPNGAKIVTRGLGASLSSQFAVLTSTGGVLIANASSISTPSNNYALYFNPNYTDHIVYKFSAPDSYNYLSAQGFFYYQDKTATYNMYIGGITRLKEDYTEDNETFNLSNGSGYYWLPSVGVGVVTSGHISGSGKHVLAFSY